MWDLWQAAAAPPVADALAAMPAALPDPATIPPRAWLYGTRLIRRYVSVMVAPGGVGKSALALAQAVALASGRGFLGEHVHHSVPAWVLNLEDPLDELHRRLAALMRRHGIERGAVEGRLFLHSGRARRIAMAEVAPEGGVVHPDRDAIVAAALAAGIGLIVVDPFVKSHRLDENSNADMDAAATAWAEVAERTEAAVLLVHHVRKGGDPARRGGGADVDAARGAKSLTDAARSASVLAPMSADEAVAFGVPDSERWRHVRLDDAKSNLAPPAGRHAVRALWYRLETVALGNATPAYPNGDHVAAIAAWAPPASPTDGLGTPLDRPASAAPDPSSPPSPTRSSVHSSGSSPTMPLAAFLAESPARSPSRSAALSLAASPAASPAWPAPSLATCAAASPAATFPAASLAGSAAMSFAASLAPSPAASFAASPAESPARSSSRSAALSLAAPPAAFPAASPAPSPATPVAAVPAGWSAPSPATPAAALPIGLSAGPVAMSFAALPAALPAPSSATPAAAFHAALSHPAASPSAQLLASPFPPAFAPRFGAPFAGSPPTTSAVVAQSAADRLRGALARIDAGPGNGLAYSAHRSRPGARDRWVGRVLVEQLGLDEAAAASLAAEWLARGVLVEARYRDPLQRKPRIGVRVADRRAAFPPTPETSLQKDRPQS